MDIFQTEPNLTPTQQAAFEQYAALLHVWNQKFNLTAIREPNEIWNRHFRDSLTCLRVMRGTPLHHVIDIGTGAGFPGLVLKIACPEMHLTLVESVGKKATFCAEVVRTLGLANVDILTARAEELGQNLAYRARYDWAVARAVAPLPVLVEYLLPFVKIGGKMLAQKGKETDQEVKQAQNALKMLGGDIEQLVPVPLPGGDAHTLIVITKSHPTPDRFPRRVGIPAKRPL